MLHAAYQMPNSKGYTRKVSLQLEHGEKCHVMALHNQTGASGWLETHVTVITREMNMKGSPEKENRLDKKNVNME